MQVKSTINLATLLVAVIIISLASVSIAAQGMREQNSNDVTKGRPNDPVMEAIDAEMKAKREIRLADKQYRDNLNRAETLSILGEEIETAYKKKNSLDREDLKKLEKLEKLTKGIREAAGGSEDDVESEHKPSDLSSAVSKMAGASDQLKRSVYRTPKHVISALVIGQANELLELIRVVRTLSPKE